MRPREFPSTSVNFGCSRDTFCTLPSTSREARRPTVIFCKFFVYLEDLPSTSVNFLCSQKTFRQLLVQSVDLCQLSVPPGDFPSTSVNLLCHQKTFRQLSVQPETFRQFSSSHRKLTVGDGRFPSRTKCSLKFTEGLPVSWKVDRS